MRGLLVATLLVGVGVGGTGAAAAAAFPAAWLPRHGDGYLVPDTWAARGLRYGRPELIGLVERSAARVAGEIGGALLYVADLSSRNGAWTQWHRSHRNGCDADLLFFAVHDNGDPAAPPREMVPFDAGGEARLADGTVVRFDVARNWALVRALLEDEGGRVTKIFVSEPLRALLLGYAIGIEERPALLARAAAVLVQPSDSLAHDDHFHVRIAAPEGPPRPQVAARSGKPTKARPALRGKPPKLARHKPQGKLRAVRARAQRTTALRNQRTAKASQRRK